MQSNRTLFTLENPAINEILLSVGPVVYGRFGVFADASLIAIHENRDSANAHCQRLIQSQGRGAYASPRRRQGDRSINTGMFGRIDTNFLGM